MDEKKEEQGKTELANGAVKKEQLDHIGLKTDQYAKQLAAMKVPPLICPHPSHCRPKVRPRAGTGRSRRRCY